MLPSWVNMSEAMENDFLWKHLRELPYFRSILRAVEAQLFQDVSLERPILDVGSGDGHFASVTFGHQVDVGLDPDRTTMPEAIRRGGYRWLIQADGGNMPFANRSFASAFSNSVLEHIPQLETVLHEVGRVLKSGAPFVFTVPNPGYQSELSISGLFERMGLKSLAQAYESWFMRMSRTWNLYYEDGWQERLSAAGFEVERSFRYFPPASLHALEWGHYFGAACLLPRWLIGRWIIAPTRWNLRLTERIVRRYYEAPVSEGGTYSFYLARKRR
jgi:SAM-dependent methyltransferase